jgi:hypothetical protein
VRTQPGLPPSRGEVCWVNPPAGAKGARVAEAKKACDILKARPLFAPQIDGRAVVASSHYDEFLNFVHPIQSPDFQLPLKS